MSAVIHLGTGNYNHSTAKLYNRTAESLPQKSSIGEDATAAFICYPDIPSRWYGCAGTKQII